MSDVYRINGIIKPNAHPEIKERYYEDLILITKALNGNWQPDWSKNKEYRYFPYFTFASGLRFLSTGYCYGNTLTIGGFCLCFKNNQIAEYAGKIFLEQYEKIMKFY